MPSSPPSEPPTDAAPPAPPGGEGASDEADRKAPPRSRNRPHGKRRPSSTGGRSRDAAPRRRESGGGKFKAQGRAGGKTSARGSKPSDAAAGATRREDKRGPKARDGGPSRRGPRRDDAKPQRAGRAERTGPGESRRGARPRPHGRHHEGATRGKRPAEARRGERERRPHTRRQAHGERGERAGPAWRGERGERAGPGRRGERERRTVHRKAPPAVAHGPDVDSGQGAAEAPPPADAEVSAAPAPPADPALLEQRIGHTFADAALLRRALTHGSAGADNYERLEFLGDAALGFVVGQWLFEAFPDASEQRLTLMRTHVVSASALAEVAGELELGAFLSLSVGERRSNAGVRPSILADALEAVLGAVVCDGGVPALATCVRHLFARRIAAAEAADLKDPKTRLQEHLQQRGLALPRYEIAAAGGLAHAPVYAVECVLDALGVRTKGIGGSRREAEKQAAEAALATLARAAARTPAGQATRS